MASSDYNYDDGNTHAPFFILTIAGLFAIPLTYNIFKSSDELENTATRIESDYKPKDDGIIQAQRRKQKRKERKTKRIMTACILWAVVGYMIYLISIIQSVTPKGWDPYEILGVSRSASEKEIDRFYKKLSIKYHPDKARPDLSKNETEDTINDRWVEMSKAHKALTDEETRNNWLLYGNPDGKQSTSVGIAIPKWVVEEGNRWFVIGFYGALLGVILPYVVGKWWYGTQALTKDRILHSSAGKMFREWKEDIDEGALVCALSSGDEYQALLQGSKADSGAAKVESKVLSSGLLSGADVKRLKSIDDPVRRKTLSLLWAYLGRLDLDDEELNRQKYEVAPAALLLDNSFSSITLPFLIVEPLLSAYRNAQNLIQAVPPQSAPVLQLPHFTPAIAQKLSGAKPASTVTVQRLMTIPNHIRRSLCSDLSDTQYKEAMHVASQIPALQVERAFFKVIGDRVVTPGSLVQLVVKARVIPPGITNVPSVDPLDLEDVDPDEGDVDAIKGRKPAKARRRKTADGQYVEDDAKDDSVQPPLAYAPFYPADHAPRWHVFLSESRTGRIAVPPFTFTAFDRPIFTAEGKPTFNVVTHRFQFQAPPQVHAFPFTMHLVCDSYIGFDLRQDVVLDVKPVSEADEVESDEDISEPEEDSLAGQLQAMKQGNLGSSPSTKKKGKRPVPAADESSGEEDSDTEGSADDTSETDTETEDEDD